MEALWARLQACERKIENLIRAVMDLKRQVTMLEQQLKDLRGS